MVAVNVIAADDDATAEKLFTSAQQAFTNVIRGSRGQLPPPVDDIEAHWSPAEKAHVSNVLRRSYVGSADTVREGLESVIAETEADELIVAAAIHDHSARVHSYEILATVQQELAPGRPAEATATDGDRDASVRRPDRRRTSGAQSAAVPAAIHDEAVDHEQRDCADYGRQPRGDVEELVEWVGVEQRRSDEAAEQSADDPDDRGDDEPTGVVARHDRFRDRSGE